jgi:hypothetical protein
VNISHSIFSISASQNPRRARPTQLSANIEQAIAVSETKVATALAGCMTKPQLNSNVV